MTAPVKPEGEKPPEKLDEAPPEQKPVEGEFDRAKLHPALRDMRPEEITELFETMANTIRTVQERPAPRDISGVPEHARVPPPPRREEPPPEKLREQYKELLDPASEKFDPETAFRDFANRNYGKLFGDINARSIRGLFGSFRAQLPDFKDHEDDVMEALKTRDPTTLTEQDVLSTYFAVKGMKATIKERQAAAKAATTVPPTPKEPGKKEVELSDLEVTVAERMFKHIPDRKKRVEEYRKFAGYEEGISMTVPVGGGKKE